MPKQAYKTGFDYEINGFENTNVVATGNGVPPFRRNYSCRGTAITNCLARLASAGYKHVRFIFPDATWQDFVLENPEEFNSKSSDYSPFSVPHWRKLQGTATCFSGYGK